MSDVLYTYTKTVVVARLEQEIKVSAIATALDYITAVGTTVNIYFKGTLSSGDVTLLNNIVTAHIPTPMPDESQPVSLDAAKSNLGNLLVEPAIFTGPVGSKSVSMVTPDLTDRTSWYQKSVQITNETLTDSGDGLTFTSVHPWWINTSAASTKLTYTYKQVPKRDGTFGNLTDWAVSVKVNGTSVSSSTYTVDYVNGKITFNSSQSGNTVQVTYWTNDGVTKPSEWLLVPPAGKKYIVQHAEVQFSVNAQIKDTIRFEIWGGGTLSAYGSFPDYLFDAGYGQFRADYRNARDLINAANEGQGVIAKIGELTSEVVVMPFNYIQAFALDSAVGAMFRLTLLNDTQFIGELTTCTFYLQMLSD